MIALVVSLSICLVALPSDKSITRLSFSTSASAVMRSFMSTAFRLEISGSKYLTTSRSVPSDMALERACLLASCLPAETLPYAHPRPLPITESKPSAAPLTTIPSRKIARFSACASSILGKTDFTALPLINKPSSPSLDMMASAKLAPKASAAIVPDAVSCPVFAPSLPYFRSLPP